MSSWFFIGNTRLCTTHTRSSGKHYIRTRSILQSLILKRMKFQSSRSANTVSKPVALANRIKKNTEPTQNPPSYEPSARNSRILCHQQMNPNPTQTSFFTGSRGIPPFKLTPASTSVLVRKSGPKETKYFKIIRKRKKKKKGTKKHFTTSSSCSVFQRSKETTRRPTLPPCVGGSSTPHP